MIQKLSNVTDYTIMKILTAKPAKQSSPTPGMCVVPFKRKAVTKNDDETRDDRNNDNDEKDDEDNEDNEDDDNGEEGDDACCHQMVPDVPDEPPYNKCRPCGRRMGREEEIQACKLCGYDECSECIKGKENQDRQRNDNCDILIVLCLRDRFLSVT